jgi:hypothetical protein
VEPKIELKENKNGLLWPYYQEVKALSASSLTEVLKQIEYGDLQIPEYVLRIAALNGKSFHQIIQDYFQKGPNSSSPSNWEVNEKVYKKLHETIDFIEKEENQQVFSSHCFLGKERLHYTFYKEVLIATYTDLEFEDYIVELKSNNVKMHESPLTLLTFEIQLLIQRLCTKKEIYLLWSTGSGVIFHQFKVSDSLLKVLDTLIDLVKKKDDYSLEKKREIVEKILLDYSPRRLIGLDQNT